MAAKVELYLSAEDLALPRHLRQFPYRPPAPSQAASMGAVRYHQECSDVREAISDCLSRHRWAITKAVMKAFGRQTRDADIDDEVQVAMIHLAYHSLPRFDRDRGAKVITFTYRCANRYACSRRRWRKPSPQSDLSAAQSILAPDTTADHRVEELAAHILAHPQEFMTARQSEILESILSRDDAELQAVASKLGYHQPSSLSTMTRRIREAIVQAGADLIEEVDEEIGETQNGQIAAIHM